MHLYLLWDLYYYCVTFRYVSLNTRIQVCFYLSEMLKAISQFEYVQSNLIQIVLSHRRS